MGLIKMPTATEDLAHKVKDSDINRERFYILYYIYQNRRTEPKTKVFPFKGPLAQAIIRGRNHCEKMNYKWITVRPFIVDLEEQEERKLSNPEFEDDIS